jgi:hypothetical protein
MWGRLDVMVAFNAYCCYRLLLQTAAHPGAYFLHPNLLAYAGGISSGLPITGEERQIMCFCVFSLHHSIARCILIPQR